MTRDKREDRREKEKEEKEKEKETSSKEHYYTFRLFPTIEPRARKYIWRPISCNHTVQLNNDIRRKA